MAHDAHGRRIDYLRVSLTDRCNLRCIYCMPAEGIEWRPPEEILSYEEIELFTRVAVDEGISKVRLTGGEPLVRRGIVDHVRRMAGIVEPGSLALTTNGILLEQYAGQLAEAGLSRVNVSIDTLDPDAYRQITRGGDITQALAGVEAVLAAGMTPVKINVVVVRGFEQDLAAFAKMTISRPVHVRFIEYMPVGACETSGQKDAWRQDATIPCDEVLDRLAAAESTIGAGPLEPVSEDDAPGGWGPARYLKYREALGTVGVISPLSHHFCSECNRLRLTADGKLRPCLFDDAEIPVRDALAQGEDAVRAVIRSALGAKPVGHGMRIGTSRRMSQIGG